MTEKDETEDLAQKPRSSIWHFSQSNPTGSGQGSVPALLRRVADSIERRGDVIVEDITFRSEPTAGERDLAVTVYYHDASETDEMTGPPSG
jgi:hypothetical protein